MASISRLRYGNLIYENGNKRYNDEIFQCAGHNMAVLLENGGGKTVFIQAALQAVLPHNELGERKVKETFSLEGEAAHIAIEWIISDKPRRYALTAVTLYLKNNELKSYKYVYEYGVGDKHSLENLPFTQYEEGGEKRAADKGEMWDYYQRMSKEYMNAQVFTTNKDFHAYIEEHFKIIAEEWRSIALINGGEGDVDAFFDGCKSTNDLVEKLLLPTVEQGLIGKGSEEFADTFESQREHFKKHKQLERSIKESEGIKKEIDDYVNASALYDTQLTAYENKKEKAKALWQLIVVQEDKLKESLRDLRIEQEKAEDEKKALERKEKLIEITVAKVNWENARENYQNEDELYQKERRQKVSKEQKRHLLKLSGFKHQMEEAIAKIQVAKEQLAALDNDEEIDELKEQLEENSCFLKGYFEGQLACFAKEKQRATNEKEREEERQKSIEAEKECIESENHSLKADINKLIGGIERNQKEMQRIKGAILAQSTHEEVEVQSKAWQKRIAEIEAHKTDLGQQLNQKESRQAEVKRIIEEKNNQRASCNGEKSRVEMQIKNIEEEAEEVLLEVKKNLSIFYSLTSIYNKPRQVMDTLEERVEKLNEEKEAALFEERKQSRFCESYESHEYFTAEPLLENWIEKWYMEFSFLQSGTAFIQNFEDDIQRKAMEKEPKWAELVIVADGQEEKLLQKIETQKHKMTYPVGILTLSQANQMLQKGMKHSEMIYPTIWEESLQLEKFKILKIQAREKLETFTQKRKEKDAHLKQVEQCLSYVRNFFEKYPHDKYIALVQQHEHLSNEENELLRNIEVHKQEIEKIEEESKAINNTLNIEIQEQHILEGQVKEANQYMRLKRENEGYDKQRILLNSQSMEKEKVIVKLSRDLQDILEALDQLKGKIGECLAQIGKIKDDVLYKEVQTHEAIYTNASIQYLREKQQELKNSLEKKQKGRSEIESIIKQNQENLSRNEENFNQGILEMEVHEEIPVYSIEYPNAIEKLTQDIKKLEVTLEDLDGRVKTAKTDFDKKEQVYQSKKSEYESCGEVIKQFVENCGQAKKEVAIAKKQLKEKQKYLYEQSQKGEQTLEQIKAQIQLMDKKDVIYNYGAQEVKIGVLEEDINEKITYMLEATVMQMLNELEKLYQSEKECKDKLDIRREKFISFCKREISDSKLRHMAIQGISQKERYEELIKWQEMMVQRISATVIILQKDLQDHDKIISQFIIHLYTYLTSVATELKEIPQKTRVKTEEGWKAIYEFNVPSWQESESKEKIRKHINHLLDDIDGEFYLTAEGKEDTQKIEKYVKEQFKLKQLLKVVMGNDSIKVRCRKVSNLNNISTQMFSWESSTKWSGGEKWSKNMALYLGILNYLAEKKQNISHEPNKVNRVVILDNPFGKASSSHVLEPVFFIAKQIGFQIIALTAHSEGDFIRKYFPIVYSCKLRSTADYKTAIFSKEQEIKKAYFIDNDPVALSILGSSTQMSLF